MVGTAGPSRPPLSSGMHIRAPRFFHPKNRPRDQFVALFGRFVAFFVIFIAMGWRWGI